MYADLDVDGLREDAHTCRRMYRESSTAVSIAAFNHPCTEKFSLLDLIEGL